MGCTSARPVASSPVATAIATVPAAGIVLLLIGVEELSYAEAARVLDVPQGTIMSRLSRARERLRRLMAEGEAAASRPSLRIVP